MPDQGEFVSPGMLVQQVQLAEYVAEQLTPLIKRARKIDNLQEVISEMIAKRVALLESRSKPGDEWWTWILATEALMQSGGLA